MKTTPRIKATVTETTAAIVPEEVKPILLLVTMESGDGVGVGSTVALTEAVCSKLSSTDGLAAIVPEAIEEVKPLLLLVSMGSGDGVGVGSAVALCSKATSTEDLGAMDADELTVTDSGGIDG